ncbi:hypothetical protein BKA61DRAFT_582606 [Leptodontidium sp. MPI-SDFR-AT-0119]|nr:hypothetical protein BKA61DRAFT_582606 [Leptodontidium sp. MPI-SDFR-AT-0119]
MVISCIGRENLPTFAISIGLVKTNEPSIFGFLAWLCVLNLLFFYYGNLDLAATSPLDLKLWPTMHRKYGNYIWVGPNEISIMGSKFILIGHGIQTWFPKGPGCQYMLPNQPPSLTSILLSDEHKARLLLGDLELRFAEFAKNGGALTSHYGQNICVLTPLGTLLLMSNPTLSEMVPRISIWTSSIPA